MWRESHHGLDAAGSPTRPPPNHRPDSGRRDHRSDRCQCRAGDRAVCLAWAGRAGSSNTRRWPAGSSVAATTWAITTCITWKSRRVPPAVMRRRQRHQPPGARHLPRPGSDHHLRMGLEPGAEAAYRAAYNLAADDDLADLEFDTDEQARQAGFAPAWRIGRYLCTDPEQYSHANVHGTPGGASTQEQQAAEDQAAQAARQTEQRTVSSRR